MPIFPSSAGWKESGPRSTARISAVHGRADPGQARRQEQCDRSERDQVAIALEHVVVAKEDDRRGERGEAEEEEGRLLDGQALLDPVEHHEARPPRATAQSGKRYGSASLQRDAQEEVGRDADREEVAAVGEAERADLVGADREDRRETGADQERDRESARRARGFARSSASATAALPVLLLAVRRRLVAAVACCVALSLSVGVPPVASDASAPRRASRSSSRSTASSRERRS